MNSESESSAPAMTIERRTRPIPAPRSGRASTSDVGSTRSQLNPEAPEFSPAEPVVDPVLSEPRQEGSPASSASDTLPVVAPEDPIEPVPDVGEVRRYYRGVVCFVQDNGCRQCDEAVCKR